MNARPAILRLVEDDLGAGQGIVIHRTAECGLMSPPQASRELFGFTPAPRETAPLAQVTQTGRTFSPANGRDTARPWREKSRGMCGGRGGTPSQVDVVHPRKNPVSWGARLPTRRSRRMEGGRRIHAEFHPLNGSGSDTDFHFKGALALAGKRDRCGDTCRVIPAFRDRTRSQRSLLNLAPRKPDRFKIRGP